MLLSSDCVQLTNWTVILSLTHTHIIQYCCILVVEGDQKTLQQCLYVVIVMIVILWKKLCKLVEKRMLCTDRYIELASERARTEKMKL
jgi:hypothetical protein